MSRYIYERPRWPQFSWDINSLVTPLAEIRHMHGRFLGRMDGMRTQLRDEAFLETMTQDVLCSARMEGVSYDKDQLHIVLGQTLGVLSSRKNVKDSAINGAAYVTLDATQHYLLPLTKERLLDWHNALFQDGTKGLRIGAWRDPRRNELNLASRFEKEIEAFITWFNTEDGTDGVLRASIAHLWFCAIAPFDFGNKRIARALTDMMLARTEKSHRRYYSLSSQLLKEQDEYEEALQNALNGDLEITSWLAWSLLCFSRTVECAQEALSATFQKAIFWDKHAMISLNKRQRKVVESMLEGKHLPLTTSKWAKATKCSQDTALRDIQALMDLGILSKERAGGRSTAYALVA